MKKTTKIIIVAVLLVVAVVGIAAVVFFFPRSLPDALGYRDREITKIEVFLPLHEPKRTEITDPEKIQEVLSYLGGISAARDASLPPSFYLGAGTLIECLSFYSGEELVADFTYPEGHFADLLNDRSYTTRTETDIDFFTSLVFPEE